MTPNDWFSFYFQKLWLQLISDGGGSKKVVTAQPFFRMAK
jgi:hypothetical protein